MLRDIQGLRAIAVLLVLFFHLFPEVLPGGYVGVDIFFVLSGYLMTKILLDEQEKCGSISVLNFAARRMRRLVPAATVVIIAVAVFAPLLPATRWELISQEIVASALFFENWLLASRAVDYLAQDDAPGVLQHYWSLGVEAQFYVFWPIFLIGSLWIARKFGLGDRIGASRAITLLILISLPVSALLTYDDPARAYFATEVRVWEFAIGGAVAALALREKNLPPIVPYAGIIAILAVAAFYNDTLFFPGWIALAPCLGAAAIISSSRPTFISTALSTRPAVFAGGISYSIYLWHWPLIVFWESLWPDHLGMTAKIVILALSIGLATISKILVEDPIRKRRDLYRKSLVSGAAMALMAAFTAIIPLSLLIQSEHADATQPGLVEDYPGAAVLTGDATLAAKPPPYRPQPVQAKRDYPVANREGCQIYQDDLALVSCGYGDLDSSTQFVVVGDSHAAQLSDAFKIAAEKNGWHYTHMSKAQCTFMDQQIYVGSKRVPYTNCNLWNDQALEQIYSIKPDYVIIAQNWRYRAVNSEDMDESHAWTQGSIERRIQDLLTHGIQVIVVKDTPHMEMVPADCLAAGGLDCSRPRLEAVQDGEPLTKAALKLGIPVIDLTDAICGPDTCEAIVGNVLAWRDSNHLTATYVRTLAPNLSEQLAKIFTD